MEKASYYMSVASFAIVVAGWLVFAAGVVLRRPSKPTKDAVRAPRSWFGLVLQGTSYAIVWLLHRTPVFSPFIGERDGLNIIFQAAAVVLCVSSVLFTILAVRELGKQWSLEARLVEGHDLVRTGPYNIVRHPVYTAMLGMLIATGIVISHWAALLIAVAVFLSGTFVRIRFEERLLRDAFGEEFTDWKSRVPGLIPFLKLG